LFCIVQARRVLAAAVRAGGTRLVDEPPEAGLPLGLAALAVGARTTYAFPVGPGDQALFYTDGISEARAKAGALPAGP
jgi:hypothetical protein